MQGLLGLDVNGLCDSYCKVTLQPPTKTVSKVVLLQFTASLTQVNQQRSRTVNKTVAPEYTSLLHFPGVDRTDLSR